MKEAEILPFIRELINLLSGFLKSHHPNNDLIKRQKLWLMFCLTGILLTNTVCWASFGSWLVGALSWMFRKSRLDWDKLLKQSIGLTLNKYGISSGSLELDDTDPGD